MSRLLAAIYDPFMRASERACLDAWRGALLAGATGEVLEIGAGTGANLAHYPAGVSRLVLSESDRFMLAKLEPKARESGREGVIVREASATALPFDAGSFDAVVSTLVLCSVEDVAAVLAEVKRVLRPGGTLRFLEHVAADHDPSRLAWQRRIEPLWKRLAGNCHLTRRTSEEIRRAGFVIEEEQRESMRKALPIVRTTVRGVATTS